MLLPVPNDLTDAQREDITALLASRRVRQDYIAGLASRVLGIDAWREAAALVNDRAAFTRDMLRRIEDAGQLRQALEIIAEEAPQNGDLMAQLGSVLRGNRLGDDDAYQQFINEYEPFLEPGALERHLSQTKRIVCAVGLGGDIREIRGTGFLVGPDLVMTNFHVVEPFLNVQTDGSGTKTISESGSGSELFFLFDYIDGVAVPSIPPNGAIRSLLTAQAQPENWLLYARSSLPRDGFHDAPDDAGDCYDYVVIRLDAEVGRAPRRPGGGVKRGWLSLPDDIDLTAERRLIVYQHPAGQSLQTDIGEFVTVDRSRTRVWYSVNATNGSSGSAVLDLEGQLFALHNAYVTDEARDAAGDAAVIPNGYTRLNQGIRIDCIARDLVVQEWPPPPPLAGDPTELWSLSDDIAKPSPVIGRRAFRQEVHAMTRGDREHRVAIVTGSLGSGRRFSIPLLRRVVGAHVPVAVFTTQDLRQLRPEQFVAQLLGRLQIGTPDTPPAVDASETESRWLRTDLPRWVRRQSVAYAHWAEDDGGLAPAWIVLQAIDGTAGTPVVSEIDWATGIKDLVAGLMGVHRVHSNDDADADLSHFRWLCLGDPTSLFSTGALPVYREDLDDDSACEREFSSCLNLAWDSAAMLQNGPRGLAGDPIVLEEFARSQRDKVTTENPYRKHLADLVARLVIQALQP